MAALHWFVWLIAGILVMWGATWVGRGLEFFWWLGLSFVVIGIFKALLAFVFRKSETAAEQQLGKEFKVPGGVRYCPRCGSQLRITDLFCGRCGTRVR